MSYPVTSAYPTIINQSGTGLNGGKVYIGTAGQDPETNPIPVYWDAALTNPAAQPLTTIGGYIWNAGTPAQAYVSPATYSMRVRDRNNLEIFYAPDATGPVIQAILSALASTTTPSGASLIGNLGGGTVQDAIFTKGPSSAVIATTAKIPWKREPAAPSYPVASMAGLWPTEKVYWDHAISAEFDAVNTPVTTPLVSPASTLLLAAHNKGTDAIVVPLQTIVGVHVNGKEAAGPNFISYSAPGTLNAKLKGVEIDIQPGAGTTIAECFGLALNAFGQDVLGDAIFIEGVFGGRWGSGIRVGALNPSNGAGIYGAGSMGALLNSASGTYAQDAIVLSNNHAIQWRGSGAGLTSRMFMDATNFLSITQASAGIVIRNSGTLAAQVLIEPGDGSIDVKTGSFKINGTKVVGARDTGWVAMTGSPDKSTVFNTGTVTTAQLATRVKYLQDVLTSHGLIGS